MSQEPSKGKLHTVDNQEADYIIEAMEHAIPHNEWLGRLTRNMYSRIQSLEAEVADLKAKRSGSP